MRRYYYELMDKRYNDLGASIPDGSNKTTAVNHAKRWMRENGIKNAQLSVNSLRTSNLLDVIDIELD
ncbi:hypothetical protein [uncultured Rikenella sp.]|uniref:hypothetical protein n=1 Tax=uncultured Rikenella sp. TaxID=368003 RepID=UPI00260B65C7|nr:hypothetical protein [uncultured Rikenella sp.]